MKSRLMMGENIFVVQKHGFEEDWLFITQDNNGASVFLDLSSIPPEEFEVFMLNIRIIPNENSDLYKEVLGFLRSQNQFTLFSHIEQIWKIIVRRSSVQSKHFTILRSLYKDENGAIIYSCEYGNQEPKPILSNDISKAVYYKILDIWAYGKEQIRKLDQEKISKSTGNTRESKKMGFSGLSDLASDLD